MFAGIEDWVAGLGSSAVLAIKCALNTFIGGMMGLYIRELYRRFGSVSSNREGFGNLFPLLTTITVVIIFVVKSSLALSLGLVGALSIVRFRTAIKNPEELTYLFFCIGIGVALGAELPLLTFLSLIVISGFIIGQSLRHATRSPHNLLLTISGEAERFFGSEEPDIVQLLKTHAKGLNVQRLDLEGGRVQFQATVATKDADEAKSLLAELRTKLPSFDLSYVNLDNML